MMEEYVSAHSHQRRLLKNFKRILRRFGWRRLFGFHREAA